MGSITPAPSALGARAGGAGVVLSITRGSPVGEDCGVGWLAGTPLPVSRSVPKQRQEEEEEENGCIPSARASIYERHF